MTDIPPQPPDVLDRRSPVGWRALGQIEEFVCGAALLVVVLAVCWGVITRYVIAQPAPWSGEVAAIGFAWLIFLGASAGFKRSLHVRIDALVWLLPEPLRRPLTALVDLAIIAFCLYVAWLAALFTVQTWDNPTSVLRLPQSIIYAAPAVGFAFMALRCGTGAWRRRQTRPAGEE